MFTVPFSEVLSAELLPPTTGMWRLPGTRLHRLVVWTFRRGAANPAAWFPRQVRMRCAWHSIRLCSDGRGNWAPSCFVHACTAGVHGCSCMSPCPRRVTCANSDGFLATRACHLLPAPCSLQLVLETASEGILDDWQQRISTAVGREPRRPRRLLVFVNPFGGSRRAAQIWQNVVKPVFDKAGIKSSAVETQHGGHARTLLTSEYLFAQLVSYPLSCLGAACMPRSGSCSQEICA